MPLRFAVLHEKRIILSDHDLTCICTHMRSPHPIGNGVFQVKAMVTTFGIVGKKLCESDPGAHLDCEVPLEK